MAEGEVVGVRAVLALMEMEHLHQEFEDRGISAAEFLNLTPATIQMILPQPKYPFAVVIDFTNKYIKLLKAGGCVIHSSFGPDPTELNSSSNEASDLSRIQQNSTELNSSSNETTDLSRIQQNSTELNSFSNEARDLSRVQQNTSSEGIGKNTTDKSLLNAEENAESKSQSSNTEKESDSSSDEVCSTRKRKKVNSIVDSDEEEETSNSDEHSSTSESEDENDASKKPLVNGQALGAKAKENRSADALVNTLNLKELLKKSPMGKGVLSSFKKKKYLTNDDRGTISGIVCPWLLTASQYRPTHSHYMTLANKIVKLFPSEERKQWYIAPKEEGPGQKCKKGKLPMRIKNNKSTLVKKGALKGRSKNDKDRSDVDPTISESELEIISKEWLKRNFEPFDQVKIHWRRCRSPRIKELVYSQLSPAAYVEKWSDLLKLPNGYELILQDFESLHEILPEKYGVLEGKSENLMLNWNNFSSKVVEIMKSDLKRKQRSEHEAMLAAAVNENSRDFLILRILPDICKLNSWVKLGNARIKPTSVESQNAFILHVTEAAEFQQCIRERRNRFEALKAPIQPYITVVSDEETITATYVVVDEIYWKVSSVLKALDVCWKACFCLNCNYSPEAQHLWLLIQKTLYKVSLPEDTNFSSVIALQGRFN
ncbi:Halomucin [Frankliniella fusca]|uniref:Halomucin n=1 Tax=Frankliniella fusca TaxID=407009 RepID=A0AAE1HPJ0_9NEOP|nr:Halomucin [Frankliniella fusca]